MNPYKHYHGPERDDADGPCYACSFDEGATAERARIVLYLREMGSDDEANEIERGAHLAGEK